MNHKDLKEQASRQHADKIDRIRRACGGSQSKTMADREVHKHERHMHSGERETRLLQGGAAKRRLDRVGRACGGSVKGKGKTEVNIIVSPSHGQEAMRPPISPPPQLPIALPPKPPIAAAPPVIPPGPSAMPPINPAALQGMPPRKRGGKVGRAKGGKVEYTAGAMTGLGRLQKAANYGARK